MLRNPSCLTRISLERDIRLQAQHPVSQPLPWMWSRIQSQRLWIHDRLPESSLLRALILGGRFQEDALLRTAGFVHLSTLTGIHLWLCLTWLNRLKIRGSFFLGSCLIAWLWCLSGLRWGLLRPWSILLLRAFLRKIGCRTPRLLPLAGIIGLEVCILYFAPDPWQQEGMLIYALAVGGGALTKNWLKDYRHTSLSIGSALLPGIYEAWHTGLIALGTPLWSLLSLPLLISCLFPILLLALLTHNPWLMDGVSAALTHLMASFNLLARLPGNLWVLQPISLCWGFLLALALQPKPKHAGLCLLFLILARFLPGEEAKPSRLVQLDVGQGDALLIQGYEDKTGLLDTGPPLPANRWLQYFAKFGIDHLDFVGLTHLDQDHAGSLATIRGLISIGCLAVPTALHYPEALPFDSDCMPGWKTERSQGGPNGDMGILLLPFYDGFYLNAGDAPAAMERTLFPPMSGRRRILKLSHHGSITSSDPLFLKRVEPTEVWISAGRRNPFGHPHLGVLARIPVPIRRTDYHGDITLSLPKVPTETKK